MVRIAPGTKPWDALMETVLDGIEGKADAALAAISGLLSAAANLTDLEDVVAARTALDVYSKAQSDALSTVNGIDSIVKIDTSGLVDTYRITLDDASTHEFTVTNGAPGEDGLGIAGIALHSTAPGPPVAKTYRITYDDASTVDFVVTDGAVGPAGPSPTLRATSVTSRSIGTGSKQFDVAMTVAFPVGMVVRITSDADPTNYMAGMVTAATTSSVTVNVAEIGGSGTKTDWTIVVGAFRGVEGPAGSANISGPAGSIPGPYPDGTATYEY
jgi:hypothetical protein